MNTTLLNQLVEPFTECLTPEAARKIASLRATDKLQARVDELADKANQGTLTDGEAAEYDQYLAGFHFATVMQARARRLLRS